MFNSDFINKVKELIPNFPEIHSGLGRSERKREQFRILLANSEYSDLLRYSLYDAYYLISSGLRSFPKCSNPKCSNEITGRHKPKYCCMACYKSDDVANNNLSKIKEDLYANPIWKEQTESKRKTTNVDRFGCEHPMQNPEFFEKHEKASFQAKEHAGMTGLRGYEPIVLDYFMSLGFSPNKDIVNGTTALKIQNWKFVGKNGNYQLPDFYLPAYATFVEVKSDYTLKITKRYLNCSKYLNL